MNKLAVLFPSRHRPEGLKKAYESWKKNSVQSDIFFCFQDSDEFLEKNIEIIEDKPYIVAGDIGLAAKVNKLCDLNPGYDAYMVLNDDQIIHSYQWDAILLAELDKLETFSGHRLWILHWRDGIQDEKLCQGFMTKEMLEITGSYLPRNYMRHLFTDNSFMLIGKSCGILKYVPEVYIEHLHYSTGKSQIDASYQQSNSSDAYLRDQAAYFKWAEKCGLEIIRKIDAIKESHLDQLEQFKFGPAKQLSPEQNIQIEEAFTAARLGTLDIIGLINTAETLEAANLRSRSIQLYRQWLEHEKLPMRYVAYFNLGVALQNMSLCVDAEQAYRYALSLNPDLNQARAYLAVLLEQRGNTREANEQLLAAKSKESSIA